MDNSYLSVSHSQFACFSTEHFLIHFFPLKKAERIAVRKAKDITESRIFDIYWTINFPFVSFNSF